MNSASPAPLWGVRVNGEPKRIVLLAHVPVPDNAVLTQLVGGNVVRSKLSVTSAVPACQLASAYLVKVSGVAAALYVQVPSMERMFCTLK